jgi:uncharacterized membrane protein
MPSASFAASATPAPSASPVPTETDGVPLLSSSAESLPLSGKVFRAVQYLACAAAIILAVRVFAQFRNGVPWVAENVYGLDKEEIEDARACGRALVAMEPSCQEHHAPIASWLAYPWAIHAHGPPAVFALAIDVHNLMAKRGTRSHVLLGDVYAFCVSVSTPFALILASVTTTGVLGAAGFATLAVLWWLTMAVGVGALYAYPKGHSMRIAVHRRWMIRNYALTFSAVTIRLHGWILNQLAPSFFNHYVVGAWLGWVPNLLIAEAYVRRYPQKGPL